MTTRRLALLACGLLLAGQALAGDAPPPEPEGYRTGMLRAATPATLAGATVLDLAGLEAAVAEGAVLIDVGPAPAKPADLPPDRVWLPVHRSIAGAAWMPGAGLGDDLAPDRAALFLAQAAELTGGDPSRQVVVFCQPDCWASWNAGRRLVLAGYTAVAWFPAGVPAWQEAHPTAPVDTMPGWGPPANSGG
ncbi:MAG TPA: PQQ-dependent catabolism-associated CXXCW motif protein [Amaricoccus sp.]|nr:PQQ-dependent catabolism-associated CXXCW motif protein [Amaricoccus sp.]